MWALAEMRQGQLPFSTPEFASGATSRRRRANRSATRVRCDISPTRRASGRVVWHSAGRCLKGRRARDAGTESGCKSAAFSPTWKQDAELANRTTPATPPLVRREPEYRQRRESGCVNCHTDSRKAARLRRGRTQEANQCQTNDDARFDFWY